MTTAQPPDRTWLAVIVAIVGCLPGYLLAGLCVVIYTFFLSWLVADHWIPYLEEVVLLWFPEILRGSITGFAAMALAGKAVRVANLDAVRYATFGFWGALLLFAVSINLVANGVTIDLVGTVIFMIGLGTGLWVEMS